jgi:pimeloyl-ACP methyl ester carboxylesterase
MYRCGVIVFVHGVPETEVLWDKMRALIDADTTAVSLPGFGCERPAGFAATKDAYSDWLIGELEKIGEPVDLVGHDWGAGITYRVATTRGDLLRSWAADVANIGHPDYEWHDFAKIWQSDEGEAFFETQNATPAEARTPLFEAMGVPHDDALAMAEKGDKIMGECILALYRSATPNVYSDWGSEFRPTKAPGLVIIPTEDPFGDEAKATEVAKMLGARTTRLEGLGHWWPVQDPAASAKALNAFWKSLD